MKKNEYRKFNLSEKDRQDAEEQQSLEDCWFITRKMFQWPKTVGTPKASSPRPPTVRPAGQVTTWGSQEGAAALSCRTKP